MLLVLLFVVSLRIDFGKLLSGKEEETNERRGPPPNPVELAVSKRNEEKRTTTRNSYQSLILDNGLRSWIHMG